MISLTSVLESPTLYRLWQAPFAEDKFAPLNAHNDLGRVRRVLDVGCGPGTNVRHFQNCAYLGIDLNPKYIIYARRRHAREFRVADATTFRVPAEQRFDFILLNSFLHHIDTENVRRILSHLSRALTGDGYMHIVELILPERRSVARLLARWDRGRFARPLEQWRELFGGALEIVTFEPFTTGIPRIPLWELVYCKGRAKP
jgi:SAM-dependent methyltransferase